jgi:hypothetical protein
MLTQKKSFVVEIKSSRCGTKKERLSIWTGTELDRSGIEPDQQDDVKPLRNVGSASDEQ